MRMMHERRPNREADALRAYVVGDTSEPVVISAFRGISFEERSRIMDVHRPELEKLDGARLVILESMLLPLEDRKR